MNVKKILLPVICLAALLFSACAELLNSNLNDPSNLVNGTLGGKWEVSALRASFANGMVTLVWNDPAEPTLSGVEIRYNIGAAPQQTLTVPKGDCMAAFSAGNTGEAFTSVVRTIDIYGNTSGGILASVKLDKTVDNLVLDSYVMSPLGGIEPDTRAISAPQYYGAITWRKGDDAVSKFEVGESYKAHLTLTARSGYTFTGVGQNTFTYAGAEVSNVANSVTITFPSAVKAWFVSSGGNDINTGEIPTKPFKTLGKALTAIAAAYDPSNLDWSAGQSAAIVISGTLNLSTDATAAVTTGITIDNTTNPANTYPPIILRGKSAAEPGVIDAVARSRILTIKNGAQVTLDQHLTLKGGQVTTTGSNAYATAGGAVNVAGTDSKPSTFTVNGGTITGNKALGTYAMAGGVYFGPYATFTLNGGAITENESEYEAGGAGSYGSSSTSSAGAYDPWDGGAGIHCFFIMNGGSIDHNKASKSGGLRIKWVDAEMNGGSISYNEAPEEGGGVTLNGRNQFIMNGGTISYNISTLGSGNGAGLRSNSSIVVMNGGAISNNTGKAGGGVMLLNYTTFTMNAGTIADNTADRGGGLYLWSGSDGIETAQGRTGKLVEFTMKGGIIARNTASVYGGGVYLADNETGRLGGPGCVIIKDTSNNAGGGVIYGYTPGDPNSNMVGDSAGPLDGQFGHAVYVKGPLRRETTAGAGVYLNSTVSGPNGGWE
jgi:hypothetical protein